MPAIRLDRLIKRYGDVQVSQFKSAQMIADVQNWLDNPSTDFGWIVRGDL